MTRERMAESLLRDLLLVSWGLGSITVGLAALIAHLVIGARLNRSH